ARPAARRVPRPVELLRRLRPLRPRRGDLRQRAAHAGHRARMDRPPAALLPGGIAGAAALRRLTQGRPGRDAPPGGRGRLRSPVPHDPVRYKLTVAYDGTDFVGWQKQEPIDPATGERT